MLAIAGFVSLGVWQVQRLHWKHDLIARVDARVHAPPVALPNSRKLMSANRRDLEYLRVQVSGTYAASGSALVRAATELGTGYWAMTPMATDDGRTVWINRGFVPQGTNVTAVRAGVPNGPVEVTGLLRPSEPGGSLLQSNRPDDDRWYSRDVAALSLAKGTKIPLSLFVDAQAERMQGGHARVSRSGVAPVPGLTVVQFADNHLAYAITWFALAGLSGWAVTLVWRRRSATLR